MPGAVPPLAVSWAEHWEDVRLWRALGHLKNGFYVDVGAMDPSADSVTKVFYEKGWSGLDVEPDPHYAELLRRERPRDRVAQVAAGLEPSRATLHLVTSPAGDRTGLTTLETATAARHADEGSVVTDIVVDVVPLADLMVGTPAEDPSRFHFLKVDVEGRESAVLAGANLQRFRPIVALVEARAPRRVVDTYFESEEILTRAGYAQVADDGLNRWYVRNEDAALSEVLAPEVNPLLDGRPRRWWEFERERELVERMQELDIAARSASREAGDLRKEAEALRLEPQALRLEADGLREEADALRQEAGAARQKEEELRAALDAITRSRSWRVTAPLRALTRAFRRPSS